MSEESIFLAALERKSPADRAAFLDEACVGDPALRERIEALLSSHADPDSFLDLPAVARQMPATTEPVNTKDFPASGPEGDMRTASAAQPTPSDETRTYLGPASQPGSLGRLDHYEILEEVGRGAMGVVFKAFNTKLRRVEAIKVLAPHLAASGIARQRFFREARSAAAVRDDHVVSIHSVSDEDGPTPYLAMEFISGITLEKRIKKTGLLAVKEVLRIGMQAARGLSAAHRQGLIHRDIKPANILLENGVERVKIADFGLARAADDFNVSQEGVIAGTPPYMSPEQARAGEVDARSDLFSLGSVLYTMCTGKQAFAAANTMAVLKRVCDEVPRPIREINPDIPESLAAVVGKLQAKEPGERYQSTAEVAEVLEEQLAQAQRSGQPRATVAPNRLRKPIGVAAAILLAGVVATLAIWAVMPSHGPTLTVGVTPPPPDPRVLTVSKNPKDGAQFTTIQAALDEVKSEMTIRVLDDAVYVEDLDIYRPIEHRGIVLEATRNATIRNQPGKSTTVRIRNVPNVTLRRLRLECSQGSIQDLVRIVGNSPGVVLDHLDITADNKTACVAIYDAHLSHERDYIVIQNCTMRNGLLGILLRGCPLEEWGTRLPINNVLIQNNIIQQCEEGISLMGEVKVISVVSNSIVNSGITAITLVDPLPGTANILITNNTIFGSYAALQIWDDHAKNKIFLSCKNMRVQNNLIFNTINMADMSFYNHNWSIRPLKNTGNIDLPSLLTCPEWYFSHNYREINENRAKQQPGWIPLRSHDVALSRIEVLSTKPSDPNFLRPPKGSPLASGGAGNTDPSFPLPTYVGAVPPEGVEPWDWQKTWDMQNRGPKDDPRVLTVSKKPEGGGQFRTIQAALDAVQPEMTIRVLDDAVYEEHLDIHRPLEHRGIVLEATGNATICNLPDKSEAVRIRNVSNVTLRGFRFVSTEGRVHDQVAIDGISSEVVLDRLDMTGNNNTLCIVVYSGVLSTKYNPILIQNCKLRQCKVGIFTRGHVRENFNIATPINSVLIQNNTFESCEEGIVLDGEEHAIYLVANSFIDSNTAAIQLVDLLPGTVNILIANNTIVGSNAAVRIWDDHAKGKAFRECKYIRVQNNLIFKTINDGDLAFNNHQRDIRPLVQVSDIADLLALVTSPEWRFSHNCRDVDPKRAEQVRPQRWIPLQPTDRVLVPQVLSTKLGDPNFLRPPKGSPLGWCGAGGDTNPASQVAFAVGQSSTLTQPWMAAWAVGQTKVAPDRSLPAYVGAVPPEGVEPWDWMKTWKMQTR